nr:MAG TPA: hypothetical protein [Caudoviricetes sp.]
MPRFCFAKNTKCLPNTYLKKLQTPMFQQSKS